MRFTPFKYLHWIKSFILPEEALVVICYCCCHRHRCCYAGDLLLGVKCFNVLIWVDSREGQERLTDNIPHEVQAHFRIRSSSWFWIASFSGWKRPNCTSNGNLVIRYNQRREILSQGRILMYCVCEDSQYTTKQQRNTLGILHNWSYLSLISLSITQTTVPTIRTWPTRHNTYYACPSQYRMSTWDSASRFRAL